jgi:hypothetical protein
MKEKIKIMQRIKKIMASKAITDMLKNKESISEN